MRRAFGVLFVLVLGMTACSSSPKTPTTVQAQTHQPPISATTSTVNTSQDKAEAQSAVLMPSDLPTGWESAPHSNSGGDSGKELAACLGVDESVFGGNKDVSADSDDFSMSNGREQITNTVSVSRSAMLDKAAFDIVAGPKFAPCLNEVLKKGIGASVSKAGSGATLGTVTTHAVNFPAYLDRSAAFRTTINFQVKGLSLAAYADFVLAQKGRITTLFAFIGTPTPMDSGLEMSATHAVAGRIAAVPQ